ncbi:MAG TPA: hypothetical protein VEK08_23610 [Planctomycetota bacterium]|nr:hypothetical protein [Planctomycetota bacterium]
MERYLVNDHSMPLLHRQTQILMLLAALLLGLANMTPREPGVLRLCESCPLYECGWPAVSLTVVPQLVRVDRGFGLNFIEQWQPMGAAANVMVCLLALAVVVCVSEWLCRRNHS